MAGCEGVNDADRPALDRVGRSVAVLSMPQAASASQMGRFETGTPALPRSVFTGVLALSHIPHNNKAGSSRIDKIGG